MKSMIAAVMMIGMCGAIVISFVPAKDTPGWYAQGVSHSGDGYSYDNIPGFLEGIGYVSGNGENENSKNYGVYWERTSSSIGYTNAREKGSEVNLFGMNPIYEYYFVYNLDDPKATRFDCNVYFCGVAVKGDLEEYTPMN